MKAKIFIKEDYIGNTNFRIADERMGGIIGDLIPNESYKKYQGIIQSLTEKKGIANISDFNFRIIINDGYELNPIGGIGITDSEKFNEIIIESAGNELKIIDRIKKEASR